MYLKTSKTRTKLYNFAGFFLLAFMAIAILRRGDNGCIPEERENSKLEQLQLQLRNKEKSNYDMDSKRCNLFSGRWVFDNVSYPLYEERECSFMLDDHACTKFGRKDVRYQNWRWQPLHCDLPRFNGTALLEKIRGKRVVFVGDSLNRNQWASMLCLIESSLNQSSKKSPIKKRNLLIFEAIEYKATIEFYWSPFLVESNGDDPIIHRLKDRVIRLMGIDKHARHWNDADILIFNSYLWWMDPLTVVWGSSLGSSDAINKTVEKMHNRLYEMALDVWSDWIEININRTKTKMFFMSPSPFHLYGKRWEEQRNCYNETEPILEDRLIGLSIVGAKMRIAELALKKLETRGVKIEYLNMTHLSEYRKDAHPSIYKNFFHTISEEQRSNPISYSDCTHWCLPGVPEVWNQILYSYIMNS